MGGAFEVPGNITPTAEFNFFMDPEAAQIVLESGLRSMLVGLDVCHQTHLTRRQLAATGFTTDARTVRAALLRIVAADTAATSGPTSTTRSRGRRDPSRATDARARVRSIETAGRPRQAPARLAPRPALSVVAPRQRPQRARRHGVDVAAFETMFSERVLAEF